MTVDSYLELYGTLIGWRFYGVIWDVLAETGIAYLPFLGILLENWTEPARGGEFGNAWNLSQKRMETDLFLAFFVLGFAGIPNPLTPFDATRLSYEPPPMLGDPAPATATPADSKSTFGSNNFRPAPLDAALVDVPPWWYTVIALSSAFDHAIVAGLPDSGDLRALRQQAQLAEIPLAEEIRGLVSALGTGFFYLLFQFVIEVLVPTLLLVQPLILLGIYSLLPFIVVLSRYSLSLLVLGGMAIFTVKFWTVLWHIAAWLDENLMLALYPGIGDNLMAFLGSTIQGRPGEHTTNRMLLDMITASLDFGLPLLWSGMMARVGIRVGRSVEGIVSEAKSIGQQAGSKGAAVASRASRLSK
jgi:hypothetical protein